MIDKSFFESINETVVPEVSNVDNQKTADIIDQVEQSNKLLLGQKGTHPHDKLSLRQRSYLTVPFLGRGKGNIDAESKLFHGETHCEHKKSEFPDSEKCYIEYSNTPQLPEIEHTISNPDYLVESSGNGWIRGGLPSRELNRDNKVNK